MGSLFLLQVVVDLGFIAIALLLLVERSRAKNSDNPRMSRGLQLLTSKIAVLQDLMDRSETMGKQLTQILEKKQQETQEKVEEIEIHLHKVQQAIERSKEVAKIFQDKIPHQEIIERQTSLKYFEAAKLASQGVSIEVIAEKTDIPLGELELIVKLNRDRLVHTAPSWAGDNQAPAPTEEPKEEFQEVATVKPKELQLPPQRGFSKKSSIIPKTAAQENEKIKPLVFRRVSFLDDLK